MQIQIMRYIQTKQQTVIIYVLQKRAVKPVKPAKNSTRPYLNEIPAHFIHEIKTKGYDAIGVNVFPPQVNEIPLLKKE